MSEANDQPLLSVIIPCLSHVNHLERCLRSVARQTLPDAFEIIVVDAGSNPDVQEKAALFRGVRVVSGAKLLGPAEARNRGAGEARGILLAFLDADCEAQPDWLEGALTGLEGGASLVGGPVINARPFRWISSADNMLSFTDQGSNRPDGPAEYFPGCNIAISLADFRASGGFPEALTLSGEDIFFCDRVKAHCPGGLRFINLMRIRHAGRSTLAEYCRHQNGFGYYRATLNLRLKPVHRRLGRYAIMIVPVMIKRFLYILFRSARWNRRGLFMSILLGPILLIGLAAWAKGFCRGCREEITDIPLAEGERGDE